MKKWKLPLTETASLAVRDTRDDGYHVLICQKGNRPIKITKTMMLRFVGPTLIHATAGIVPIAIQKELVDAIINLVNGSINLENFLDVYHAIHPTS